MSTLFFFFFGKYNAPGNFFPSGREGEDPKKGAEFTWAKHLEQYMVPTTLFY